MRPIFFQFLEHASLVLPQGACIFCSLQEMFFPRLLLTWLFLLRGFS